MSSVTISYEKRSWCDVLCYPVGVPTCAIEGGGERGCGAQVGDGTWEAILEDSRGVDWWYGRYARVVSSNWYRRRRCCVRREGGSSRWRHVSWTADLLPSSDAKQGGRRRCSYCGRCAGDDGERKFGHPASQDRFCRTVRTRKCSSYTSAIISRVILENVSDTNARAAQMGDCEPIIFLNFGSRHTFRRQVRVKATTTRAPISSDVTLRLRYLYFVFVRLLQRNVNSTTTA